VERHGPDGEQPAGGAAGETMQGGGAGGQVTRSASYLMSSLTCYHIIIYHCLNQLIR
jgi:hypothetical protein